MESENWIVKNWRPALAWTYIVICLADFVLFPTLNYMFFSKYTGTYEHWKALTLAESGLFHLSFGSILGVTSWTRGQEKITSLKTNAGITDDTKS